MNRTIVRAVKILEILSNNKEGISLIELSKSLEIPKSSTHEIIQTLLKLKLAERNVYNPKLYVLGSKSFSIGSKYISSNDIINFGSHYLREVAEKYHKTGFIGFLDDDKVVYVYKWQSPQAKLASCDLGTRHPVYCTSLGKALLAYLPKEQCEIIISKTEFVKKTDNTIIDSKKLLEELELTRKRGYSVDNREVEYHMACFGAPVFDNYGNVVAAVSVSDLYNPDEIKNCQIGLDIRTAADKISSRLGFNPARRMIK
ncbi:MAG: IclR family transcriptional regulator [Bacilli bacterium]|nr:IclR family transcriptional regulator [Bacilli bacterium]